MSFAKDFHFNQANLQDFVDCRRRFYLKYVQKLAWPAIQSEPVLEQERHMRRGADFHRLVHQHLLGVPAEKLASMIADPQLSQWWQNYLQFYVEAGFSEYPALFPETSLSSPLAGYRLVAKYDLVAVSTSGAITIYDWKTSLRRPPAEWLDRRLQTRLYPYLMTCAGNHFMDGLELKAESVQMVYWFAEFPTDPEQLAYSQPQFQADERYLSALIDTITNLDAADFFLTDDERLCRFCVYRSLCERGVQAGLLSELEEGDLAAELDFDLDQVSEIAF